MELPPAAAVTVATAAAAATPLPAVATAVGPFVECVINAFVNTTKHLCVYTAHHLAPPPPQLAPEPTASVTDDDNIPSLCHGGVGGGWKTPRRRHRSRNARSHPATARACNKNNINGSPKYKRNSRSECFHYKYG